MSSTVPSDAAAISAAAADDPHVESTSARRRETRGRLLDAAAEVFAAEGLRGASVEAICARAGFTRGAFYSNFTTKEQLFIALLEREFAHQTRRLAEKADELEPQLRECATGFSPREIAQYVVEFLAPSEDHETWFTLELELLLLAKREPSLLAEQLDFKESLYRGIAEPVERIVAAAGRRFIIPVERALPVLGALYEDAMRASMLGGPSVEQSFDELGGRIAELLFAITEEIA
ncbi:TetR/AcrR family transcriptional regulator [Leucobacter sp. GX24907]